jgi:hypothetical protein
MPLDPIDIPPEAFAPKPWWPERPSTDEVRRLVQEIKEFVKETGTPYLWRGHTHTSPPIGATVEYWGEFDVPRRFVLEAPCPCCTPFHPKFRHNGKIGYFPDEGVVRLLGPDCFATLNAEGHREAVEALRERERRERASQYLLNNLPVVPETIRVVSAATPVARAIDLFHSALLLRLTKTLKINLWQLVREGELFLEIVRRDIYVTRDGQERSRLIHDHQVYAALQGHRMLDPRLRKFEPCLDKVLDDLRSIHFEDHEAAIAEMDNAERTEVARKLGRSIDKARRAFEEMEDVRSLVGPIATPTLREWAKQEGCPVRIFFNRSEDSFYVGTTELEKTRIPIAEELEARLGNLPDLSAHHLP